MLEQLCQMIKEDLVHNAELSLADPLYRNTRCLKKLISMYDFVHTKRIRSWFDSSLEEWVQPHEDMMVGFILHHVIPYIDHYIALSVSTTRYILSRFMIDDVSSVVLSYHIIDFDSTHLYRVVKQLSVDLTFVFQYVHKMYDLEIRQHFLFGIDPHDQHQRIWNTYIQYPYNKLNHVHIEPLLKKGETKIVV